MAYFENGVLGTPEFVFRISLKNAPTRDRTRNQSLMGGGVTNYTTRPNIFNLHPMIERKWSIFWMHFENGLNMVGREAFCAL